MDQQRYNRHMLLPEIGVEGQQKLLDAKVLVIGAGGLGCPLLQYLVAGGVGHIGIVDHDLVETSNLIRQVLFGTSSLGTNKAKAAKKRLYDLNPEVAVTAFPVLLTSKNARELFRQYDIIVDGTDNFKTRYLVNDACILTQKPLVSGSLYKFEGQLSVFNYKNGPSYRCVYPKAPNDRFRLSCSELGVLGVVSGIIGNLMANEVLKIILGVGEVISGSILHYSALSGRIQLIGIKRKEEQIAKVMALKSDFNSLDYHGKTDLHHINVRYLSLVLAKNKMDEGSGLLIDMSQDSEILMPESIRTKVLNIKFGHLRREMPQLDRQKTIIITSESDVKNTAAYRTFTKMGFHEVYVLEHPLESNEMTNHGERKDQNP